MPTFTTNFNLSKPLVNNPTDQDVWGGETNTNWDTVDGLIKVARDQVTYVINASSTLTAANRNQLGLVNAAGGAITVTFPSPSIVGSGCQILIKKTDNSTNVVTLAPSASETFDGQTSDSLSTQEASVTYVTDGVNWQKTSSTQKISVPYIQGVFSSDATVYTTSAITPRDDTVPQNTEGFQVISLAITPTSASNKLIVEARVPVSSTGGSVPLVLALFQDSNPSALYVETYEIADNGILGTAFIKFQITAGTTSSTTLSLRAGTGAGSALTFNGVSGSRFYGGTMQISMKITEVVS